MCMHAKFLQSCPNLCNPWTVAHQASLPMGFSGREYQGGLLCPPPGDLPNPGTEPVSCDSCTAETHSRHRIVGTDNSLKLFLVSCSCHRSCPYY